MIIRIVKMTFRKEDIRAFQDLMRRDSFRIRAFEGCEHLEILQSKDDPRIFFTYSHWKDENALETYRNSELFREVWSATRLMFAERPDAWTLEKFIAED